jgi:hypothetical protein
MIENLITNNFLSTISEKVIEVEIFNYFPNGKYMDVSPFRDSYQKGYD